MCHETTFDFTIIKLQVRARSREIVSRRHWIILAQTFSTPLSTILKINAYPRRRKPEILIIYEFVKQFTTPAAVFLRAARKTSAEL